jgi:hypothetical protein
VIIKASWFGTAVLLVTSVLAVTVESFDLIAAIVSLVMFLAGTIIFLWAYAIAVSRSRTVEIGIGGLYFLAGTTAPNSVRVQLLGSLAAQVVITVAAATIRPYSSVAFGILAPMWGLGLSGLWGARYGTFAPRVDQRAQQGDG